MTSSVSRTSGRVNIETGLRDLYEQLSKGTKPTQAPFNTMKDVFMLAGCVGYQMGQRKPLAGSKHQPFHYSVFSDQVDIPILKAMAIATTQNIEVLVDLDGIVSIAEEYANAGIHEVKFHILNDAGEPLWNLVELARRTESSK